MDLRDFFEALLDKSATQHSTDEYTIRMALRKAVACSLNCSPQI
jgi:hypothetical protein